MKNVLVRIPGHPYRIHIGQHALKSLGKYLKEARLSRRAVIITTPPIKALHGAKIEKSLRPFCQEILFICVPDSEKSKNARLAFRLLDKIARLDKNRGVFLIAFGGGVVGDLTGFIAAVYKRGIPCIQVPTTLLSQIDSSIGGKTAVDTAFGKNLIGLFYQPRFVISDVSLLETLPKQQLRAGLAEAVKYAAIKDKKLFSFLEKNTAQLLKGDAVRLEYLIMRCATIKADVVAQDEFDQKRKRIILNFGHTVGHAIEAASKFKIPHGEAVAIGMAAACDLSVKLGHLDASAARRLSTLLEKIGLPTAARGLKTADVLRSLRYDKKFKEGKTRFVLLEAMGKTKIVEGISEKLIRGIVATRLTRRPQRARNTMRLSSKINSTLSP